MSDRPLRNPAASANRVIGVLAEERYLSQVQPAGLMAALAERDCDIELIIPDRTAYVADSRPWARALDAVVARGRSLMLLLLLTWAERQQTPAMNSSASIKAVHDKAHMAMILAAKGLPTPKTYVAPIARLKQTLTGREHYPLILKPVFGDNGRGLRVVESLRELAGVEWPEPTVLAQRLLPSDGYDLKLYGIGQDLWAVRKPSPLPGAPDDGGPFETVAVTPAMRHLAQACRGAFGLDIYGIDCLETAEGLAVVEVNDFPNFSSVPNVNDRLADYFLARCLGHEPQAAN